MRVLCIPDMHCWYTNYARPTDDGIDTRLAEWRRTTKAMLELAVKERCALAVAPGDMFDVPRPPARAIIEVSNLFRAMEEAGIPVVGCAGNHDAGPPGQPGPVDVLASLGRDRWGITTPRVVDAAGIQVAVLPWSKPAGLIHESENAGDMVDRTTQALEAIVRALAAQVDTTRPAILIGHWAVAGCTLSSGQVLAGGEAAIPLIELQSGPWRAVIMGHIHKPQLFPGCPTVLHTGALVRRDFGEERDPRGVYIVDIETGEATWHDLPAWKFHTINMDLETQEDVQRLYEECRGVYAINGKQEALLLPESTGAIVRVTYRATEELARQVDHSLIMQHLADSAPEHIAGIYPEIVRSDRTRADGLTERTGPLDALDRWLSLRSDLSDALKADVRDAAAALLEEVA